MNIISSYLLHRGGDRGLDIPKLVKQGALVIDTRTADEFSGGHIDGAINIPYDVIVREIDKYETDKSKSIIVYCQSGGRSTEAKKSLTSAGYMNVVNGGGLHHMQEALKESE